MNYIVLANTWDRIMKSGDQDLIMKVSNIYNQTAFDMREVRSGIATPNIDAEMPIHDVVIHCSLGIQALIAVPVGCNLAPAISALFNGGVAQGQNWLIGLDWDEMRRGAKDAKKAKQEQQQGNGQQKKSSQADFGINNFGINRDNGLRGI